MPAKIKNDERTDSLRRLQDAMADFVTARDWQEYHKPKDIAMALGVEAGELQERFLWRPSNGDYLKDETWRNELADEMADVLLYLVALAEATDIDLARATWAKLERNEERFPVEVDVGDRPRDRGPTQNRVSTLSTSTRFPEL